MNSSGTTLQSSTNSGTSDETINATVTTGTYYARVYPRNNNAWNATNCYTLKVQLGTASRNAGGEFVEFSTRKMVVFPNPVGFTANLLFNAMENGTAQITVTNPLGAVVLSQAVTMYTGDNVRKLNVSKLGNGIYFIKIKTGDKVEVAKIVISK